MSATDRFRAIVNEDGSATLLGLVTARDGTGAAAPDASDGNLIVAADLTSITLKVFDIDSSAPGTAILTASLTPSSVMQATLQTDGIWQNLEAGGNFLYDVAATVMSTGNHTYEFEVQFVSTGGTVAWGLWALTTNSLRSS